MPHIRPAHIADYSTFVRLFAHLGVDNPTPSQKGFAHALGSTLIAERDGAPIGYIIYRHEGDEGLISNLVVDPTARKAGVGEKLMREAARALRQAGCRTWTLNVKRRNVPAQRLYRRLGLRPVHVTHVLRMAWSDIAALQPGGPQQRLIPVSELVAKDMVRLDRLGIARSRIARLASDDGAMMLSAWEGSDPVGVMAFRSGFPCVTAFAARDAGSAAGLLQAAAVHRRILERSREHWRNQMLQIIISRQPAVVRALVDGGAQRRFTLDFMRGNLDDLPQPRRVECVGDASRPARNDDTGTRFPALAD